jgi:uncharacterized protein DUF4255
VANVNAIAAISEAIRRYLKEAPRQDFPQLDVELYQMTDFQKPVPAGGRISLLLYRIAVNTSRRNLPPTLGEDGKTRYRPPVPLDLFFLFSAWALNAEFQQRLLGWCVRTIEDAPVMPASVLNRLQTKAVFRGSETVELVGDSLPLQDLNVLWDVLKPNVPLSVSYVARMVTIESEIPLVEGPLVQTRAFDMSQA